MASCARCRHWQVFDSPSAEQVLANGVVAGYVPAVVHCECCELGHGVGTGLFVEQPDPTKCGAFNEVTE